MCFKENMLGCLSNRNKGKVNRCISMSGCQEYLLDNDCYASLVAVLTQIQYGVSRSYQLLRCMSTRLDPIGAHRTPYRFLPCCAKIVHCSSWSLNNIEIKYNEI